MVSVCNSVCGQVEEVQGFNGWDGLWRNNIMECNR